MSGPFVITGVPGNWTQSGSSPSPPPRLEINELIKNDKQWSLYVQALQSMCGADQNDLLSHFQLGGIHGLPYVQWDKSGGESPVQGSDWSGYCTHGSVLFPTWHRPYVALYEQVLQSHAASIAANATADQADWQSAAANLRAPYWDWAVNAVPPPEVISQAQLNITGLDGQPTTIDNPLMGYTFHPIDQSFPSPYNVWPKTLRHATSNDADAQDDVDDLISDLQSEASSIRSSVYRLLTLVNTWPAFSNHTPGDGGSSSSSLEAIHDGIHVDVGGNGDMADPSVAALDPIFFLHHANVDRLLALWQSVNPGVWVNAADVEEGSWTMVPGSRVDGTTDLAPFWNTSQTYWTSVKATNFANLGYTYPEFVGLDMSNTQAVESAISTKINQLYSGSKPQVPPPVASQAPVTQNFAVQLPPVAQQPVGQPPSHAAPAAPAPAPAPVPVPVPVPAPAHASPAAQAPMHVPQQVHGTVPPSHAPMHPAQAPMHAPPPHGGPHPGTGASVSHQAHPTAHTPIDWVARVHAKKYELGTSFSVLIFIGNVPENPKQWRSSHAFVGAHHAFVNTSAERCENCRNQAQQATMTEGFIRLDDWLIAYSGLPSLEPSVVGPYLKKNLHWRVQKANKQVVPTADLPSLEVDVISTPLKQGHNGPFPKHDGPPTHHHDVTAGRIGGHRA